MTAVVSTADVERLGGEILDALEVAVIGKRPELELVLCALLADGHVLIEDLPGVGKTLIARSVAEVCSMSFARIQFTPDLIPSDVTGASIFDQRTGAASASVLALSLRTFSSPTRSIARRVRRRRRCSRRWRSAR